MLSNTNARNTSRLQLTDLQCGSLSSYCVSTRVRFTALHVVYDGLRGVFSMSSSSAIVLGGIRREPTIVSNDIIIRTWSEETRFKLNSKQSHGLQSADLPFVQRRPETTLLVSSDYSAKILWRPLCKKQQKLETNLDVDKRHVWQKRWLSRFP